MEQQVKNTEFVRDKESNALINTNVNAFKLYKQQRESRLTVESLKTEVDELKALVRELLKNQK